MEIAIEYPTLPELSKKFAGAGAIIEEETRRGMFRAVLPIEADAKREAPWDTGHLRRSITHRIQSRAREITGIVGTNVPYGRVVEEGRSAGAAMPPPGVLLDWMRRHGIDESLEYPLRRAIGRRGTTPQPYLIPAFKKNIPNARKELGTLACERILRRLKAGQ